MSLRNRIDALERSAGGGDMVVIVIEGGLPDEYPKTAEAGTHRWTQRAGETFEAFKDRAVQAAKEAAEKLVIVGGLPDEAIGNSETP